MAGREFGVFTPSEAAYTRPGAYDAMARGEATKQAKYLSGMDQFYAELEQMEKQFGERMTLERERIASQEKMQGRQLDWLREQELGAEGPGPGASSFDIFRDIQSRQFGGEDEYGGYGGYEGEEYGGRLGLAYAGLEAGRYGARQQAGGAGGGALTGGAFEPYRTTSERGAGAGQVPLDWLSEQLGLQRTATPSGDIATVGGTRAAAYQKYSAASDAYQKALQYPTSY